MNNSKQQIEQHIRSQAEVMAEWRTFAPEIRERVLAAETRQAETETRLKVAETKLAAAEQRINHLTQRIAALEMAEAARPTNRIRKLFNKET